MTSLDSVLRANITDIVQQELHKHGALIESLPESDYCTLQRAVKIYGISRPFLYGLFQDGTIQLYKVRGRSFIRISELDAAMKMTVYRQNRTKAAAESRQAVVKKSVKRSAK